MDDSYETNIVWFTESNIQKIELNIELNKVQQINFKGNLARDEDANTTMFFYYRRRKKNQIRFFSDETVKVL